MNQQPNTFEALRKEVIQNVEALQLEHEIYIVCDVFARFSILIVGASEGDVDYVNGKLIGLIQRVLPLENGDILYQDLNREGILKPIRVSETKPNIFYVDRHLHLTNWDITDRFQSQAPISCFYSFKGGLGRTTAMVLAGIHLARRGKKVVLMDFDLEAPGLATLFSYQNEAIDLTRGIVDYLTDLMGFLYEEKRLLLSDYYFSINQQEIVGNQGGELIIFPAGLAQGQEGENLYFTKLSKSAPLFLGKDHLFGVDMLLNRINQEYQPDYILVDTRTGINGLGGLFLSRYASQSFLFFFGNKQNMFGLEALIPRLKELGRPFFLVNSPVPRPPLAEEQRRFFLEKSYDLFSDLFYTQESTPFIEDETAAHFPIEIPYNDMAVLLNSSEKLKALVEEQNGSNPYGRIANFIYEKAPAGGVQELTMHGGHLAINDRSPDRQTLLEAFRDIAPGTAAAENEFTTLEELTKNFFPRKDYRFIFDKNKYLILGEKGAGKTALFAVLEQPEYAKALASFCEANSDEIDRSEWRVGMSNTYPQPSVFGALNDFSNTQLKVFWKTLIVQKILGNDIASNEWEAKLRSIKVGSELSLDTQIAQQHQVLETSNTIITLIYDYLDVQIPEDNELRSKVVSALLEVWREIQTKYHHIRAKIFLRKDIFDREVNVTDKVKFQNSSAEISWEYDQLLNVVWKRLAHNTKIGSHILDPIIPSSKYRKISDILGYLPSLTEDENRAALKYLLGEYMGGNNKAFPYNWILYHTADTKRRIQPRSLLNLFSGAANLQLEADSIDDVIILQPRYMELATGEVSRGRVQDIKEEYPALSVVFDNLHKYHEQFPVEENVLDQALKSLSPSIDVSSVKKQLEDIGVLYEYKFNPRGKQKRYHIPDLYLIGMNLKRKGPGAHKALFGGRK